MTTAPHPLNRNVFIADNLALLQAIDDESIDLICIDPPFAKNHPWTGDIQPPLSDRELKQELETLATWGINTPDQATSAGISWPDGSQQATFQDSWSYQNDILPEWTTYIRASYPALHSVISATRQIQGNNIAAYTAYLGIRLIEMRRALKPTGSIYVHCDTSANAYIRLAMDAIMGTHAFTNEIVWRRYGSHNDSSTSWGNAHDSILFYAKDSSHTWTGEPSQPYDKAYVDSAYRQRDQKGRYTTAPLHARGLSGGGYQFTWKGIADTWRFPQHRLDELDAQGLIHWPPRGTIPRRKVYLDPTKGLPLQDIIDDIHLTPPTERTGYPTQKPVALAERLILASSNPGDVVLDCFAGSGYVPIAAERHNRQWIACDRSPRTLTVMRRQFARLNWSVDGILAANMRPLFPTPNVITKGPNQLPQK